MSGTPARTDGEPAPRRALILATTMLASSMYSLDLTVVSLALPHMQGSFSATTDEIAWVVTAFIVGATVTITLVGWLAGAIGRRRLFASAVAVYMIVSILSSMTHFLDEMVLWRFIAGLTGAAIIPLSQVVAVDAYPRAQYGRALTVWGVGGVGGSIIAPPFAGLIIEHYGWSSVFFIKLQRVALTMLGVLTVVPREASDQKRALDWFGLSTLLLGLGAIQLLFNRGARLDWFSSTEIVIEAIVGAACLYLFVAHSATARDPFLRTEPLKNWNYTMGLVCAVMYGILWPLPMVLLPLLLQNFRGLPVEIIGVLMTPRQLGYMLGSLMMVPLLPRLNKQVLACAGFLGIAVTAWLMSGWSPDVGYWSIGWAAGMQGVSCAFAFNAVNALAFATLPAADRQQCVPMFYLTINLGTSLGVAWTITYWAEETTRIRAGLIEFVSPYNPLWHQHAMPDGWDMGTAIGRTAVNQAVVHQAGMIAFNDTFAIVMAIALVAATLTWVFRGKGR